MLRRALVIYRKHDAREHELMAWPEPSPVATAVVDAALELFAALLPLQDQPTAARIVAEAVDATRSARLERNVGRKAAVNVNLCTGLVLALRDAMTKTGGRKEGFGSEKVQEKVAGLLKVRLMPGECLLSTNIS